MQPIKARIGYSFFCPMPADTVKTDTEAELLPESIPSLAVSGHPEYLKDIRTCQSFLYGSGMPFSCRRFVFDLPVFSLNGRAFQDAHVLLGIYDDTHVASVSIFFSLQTDSEEELVYLRQIQTSDIPFTVKDGNTSAKQLANRCFSFLNCDTDETDSVYLIEINDYRGEEDVDRILDVHARALYGMLTGDEGFAFVGKDCADNRLSNRWSTRNFVKVIAFHENFLLLNLQNSSNAVSYRAHQKDYGNTFYGEPNPYFFLTCKSAGVNHGLFFTVETGMVAKSIASHVLLTQSRQSQGKHYASASRIYQTKMFRRNLILTLKRLEHVEIAEIGALEQMVMKGLDLLPLIEKIRHMLDLMESELDMLYQTNTNTLINILTVLGLLLAVVEIVLPLLLG